MSSIIFAKPRNALFSLEALFFTLLGLFGGWVLSQYQPPDPKNWWRRLVRAAQQWIAQRRRGLPGLSARREPYLSVPRHSALPGTAMARSLTGGADAILVPVGQAAETDTALPIGASMSPSSADLQISGLAPVVSVGSASNPLLMGLGGFNRPAPKPTALTSSYTDVPSGRLLFRGYKPTVEVGSYTNPSSGSIH